MDIPLNVLQYIFDYELHDTFTNLWVALRLLLTILIMVANYEKSFLKLKLIKTYM